MDVRWVAQRAIYLAVLKAASKAARSVVQKAALLVVELADVMVVRLDEN